MQIQQKSFSDKFIKLIKDNADKSKFFNTEKMNDMDNGIRLIDKKSHNKCLIFKTTLYSPKEHDCVVFLHNACAVLFDAENIKDQDIVNQIDELKLENSKEIKNLFKKAIEEYKRKRKYASISNETLEKIKYGSISSDDFNKEKNNQQASFFSNFFSWGKEK